MRVFTGLSLVLMFASTTPAAPLLQDQLIAESPVTLAADARRTGNATRGAAVFYARAMACSTCHSMGDRPAAIGPDLTKLDPKTSDAALIEAILEPSKTISKAYATVTVQTGDGLQMTGLPIEETDEKLVMRDAAQPDRIVTINKQDIENRQDASQSLMPSGQINQLANREQFLDLVRFLMEIRDGGPKRARELQPPPDPLTQKVPDDPLPWQPVVQRGEVSVAGNVRFPRAVAMGFVGGTVLFDADRLSTAAFWTEGFVKSSPQNYFGLYWHRDGSPPELLTSDVHPLSFQLPDASIWQTFESPQTSDPNIGTRFDGYQIGKSAIRLHYRLLVGGLRINVTEDVRAESRKDWQGFTRDLIFTGLPSGTRAAIMLSASGEYQGYAANGSRSASLGELNSTPLVSYRSAKTLWVARGQSAAGGTWQTEVNNGSPGCRLVSAAATGNSPLAIRLDVWRYRGRGAEPAAAELISLVENPPAIDDLFDAPPKPAAPLPVAEVQPQGTTAANRPAVNARENIDEFPSTRGKFLRFVVTGTTGNSEPGLDELEVYGTDPKLNLALLGKASASSVISGYAIHQIPHLNDGKLGNHHSWISSEPGGGWAQIEFPEPVEMCRIVWARDRTGVCQDRLAVAYRIEVSDDGKSWSKVGDEKGRELTGFAVGVIRRDAAPGYEMEVIPAPFPTWRPSDVAFDDGGTMYAIAMTEGQVWRTRIPPAGHPERVNWQRYATGLYHPIGVAVVDGRVYVAQKPEITELIDRDGNGTVDQYRTVASGWGLSTGWHEYCFGLAVDPQKNLWFTLNTGNFWTHPGLVSLGRWRGSVMRVEHDTEKLEEMAKGCRTPNGISQGTDGQIFFTDNQGDWIQACKLAHVVPGRFYGHPERKADALPENTYPDGRSSVWLPYSRSRSTSGPVCDTTQGEFGPFTNQMFVGDVGYGANAGILRVALEKVDGEYQGACFRFVDGQPLGCERMKFGPDNQLYMTSLSSGLTRMAFSGKTPLAIERIRIRPGGKGFVVQLTRPLSADTQLAPAQFHVKQYHYLYTGNYGSPQADERIVPVEKAELASDRMAITLTFPVEAHPLGMVYELNVGQLTSTDGVALLHNEAWYTVHRIPD